MDNDEEYYKKRVKQAKKEAEDSANRLLEVLKKIVKKDQIQYRLSKPPSEHRIVKSQKTNLKKLTNVVKGIIKKLKKKSHRFGSRKTSRKPRKPSRKHKKTSRKHRKTSRKHRKTFKE
jgi:hypothetical protein